MNGSAKLVLDHPVELADGTFVKVVLVRRPTPEDLRRIEDAAADATDMRLRAYGQVCDLPQRIIEEFDCADIFRLDQILDALCSNH